jgi:hypothetical protein
VYFGDLPYLVFSVISAQTSDLLDPARNCASAPVIRNARAYFCNARVCVCFCNFRVRAYFRNARAYFCNSRVCVCFCNFRVRVCYLQCPRPLLQCPRLRMLLQVPRLRPLLQLQYIAFTRFEQDIAGQIRR